MKYNRFPTTAAYGDISCCTMLLLHCNSLYHSTTNCYNSLKNLLGLLGIVFRCLGPGTKFPVVQSFVLQYATQPLSRLN